MEIPERISPFSETWLRGAGDHLQRYRFAAARVAGLRVLDVGCGEGYGSYLLRTAGAREVAGIDIGAEVVERARSSFSCDSLEFLQDDACVLEAARRKAPFDAVVSFENIEHLPDPEAFVRLAAQEILAPEGFLIVSTPDASALEKDASGATLNKYHLSELTEQQFCALLGKYFEQVTIFWQVQSLEGLRAERTARAIGQINASPFVRAGNLLRRMMGRRIVPFELRVRAESDFEIVPKRLWDAPVIAMVAIAEQPRRLK